MRISRGWGLGFAKGMGWDANVIIVRRYAYGLGGCAYDYEGYVCGEEEGG